MSVVAQVGEAAVAVVPVFKGFRRQVTSEVDGATADASGRFQKGFNRGAVKAGADAGKGFRQAFGSASGGFSSDLTKKFTADVASASKALSAARLKEADLAGKVRVAETQLAEATAKWGAESSKTVAAQERLASAQRNLAAQQGVVVSATERLEAAQASLRTVTAALQQSTSGAGAGFRRFFQDFASGLKSVQAGQSSFTGLGGALGSLARIALGPVISGFQRLSPLLAPVVTAFGQVRTAVAGLASSAAAKVGSLLSAGLSSARGAAEALAARFPTVAAAVQLVGKTASSVFGGFRSSLAPLGQIASIAGQAISRGFQAAFSAVKSLASDAASFVGSSMKTAAAAIATTVAAAVGSGFSRLTTIEDAQAQLKALGHTQQSVNDIIASANTSVTGTYFKLQDAITLATSATAAGIKEGQPLTSYLRLIADTATVAHSNLGDIGLVFNQIQSQGKAYTQDLNQLASRGIPIWQGLADVYHVNVDQLHDMVSSGDVDMAHFQQAMQNLVGGSAVAAGQTTSGALKNIGAALAKFGAAVDSSVFPVLQPLFQLIYNGFQAATAAVQPLADQVAPKIQAAFGPPLQAAADLVAKLSDSLKGFKLPDLSGLGSAFSALAPVLGLLAGVFSTSLKGFLTSVFPMLGKLVPAISGPFGLLLGLFASMLTQSKPLRDALGGLFQTLGSVVSALAGALGPVLAQVAGVFNEFAGVLGGVLAQVLPLVAGLVVQLANVFVSLLPSIMPLVPIVAQVAGQLVQVLGGVIASLIPVVQQLVQMLGPVLTQIFAALTPVIAAVLPVVSMLAKVLAAVFLQVMTAAMPIVTQLIGFIAQMVPVLMPIIATVLQLIGPLLQLAAVMLNLAMQVITPLIGLFATLLPPILGIVNVVIQALLPVIQDLVTILQGLITFLTGVFTGNWRMAWQGIQQIGKGFIDAIVDMVQGIGSIFAKVPGLILDALKGAGGWLVDVGHDIVNGLMDGIGDLAGKIGSWFLSKIPGWIVDPFKAALGIHSPSRVFRTEIGQQLLPGAVQGVEDSLPDATRRMKAATEQLVQVADLGGSVSVSGSSSSEAGGASVQTASFFQGATIVAPDQNPVVSGRVMGREFLRVMAGEI